MGQSPFILAQHSVPSNCDPILTGNGSKRVGDKEANGQ
jgi:hypothetical protein